MMRARECWCSPRRLFRQSSGEARALFTGPRLASAPETSPVFLYYFSRVPPGPESETYGSYHAAEIVCWM